MAGAVGRSVWFLSVTMAAAAALAQTPRNAEEQAVREAAKAYQAALAKGDAKQLAELWTADGEYTDDAGVAHPVAELIADVKPVKEGEPSPSKITSSKIRFLTADVAVEDGTSEVSPAADEPPIRGHYHAVWVKRDGRWRLATLNEVPIHEAGDADSLAELDWMIGAWTAEAGGTSFELKVQWNSNKTFLLRDLTATRDGEIVLRSAQRFGWDPRAEKLRSWSFDSDGGFGEAFWVKDQGDWVGHAVGILPDGRETTATILMTHDGKDGLVRRTLAARVEGELVGDQEEVRFTRKTESR